MTHFIITCGTSQLEKKKYDELSKRERALNNHKTAFDRFTKADAHHNNDRVPVGEKTFNRAVSEPFFSPLATTLAGCWPEKKDLLKADVNPFGAELSTLAMLSTREHNPWNHAEDSLELISSATYQGIFCTALIESVVKIINKDAKLGHCWVSDLTETPNNPDEATNNLAQRVLASLKPGEPNVLVMTGGFKSVIPALSLIAFVFGAELVYLFEQSDTLQSIHFRFEKDMDKKNQKFWGKVWRDMDKGFSRGTTRAVKTILQNRLTRVADLFS